MKIPNKKNSLRCIFTLLFQCPLVTLKYRYGILYGYQSFWHVIIPINRFID